MTARGHDLGRRGGRFVVFALWLAACSAPTPIPVERETPVATTEPMQAAPMASSSAAMAASSAAPTPSTSAPHSPAPPAKRPPRDGAPGSTRGTVSCGKTRCPAPGQACFFDEAANDWVCRDAAPLDPEPAVDYSGDDPGIRCDDGFDCPDGETCCSLWGYGVRSCVKRAEVGALCVREVCMKDGARCPPGRTCDAVGHFEGECAAPKGPATCGNRRGCPESKPICALTDNGPVCVAEGTPEHDAVKGSLRFRCTRQNDCHLGETCQYVFGEVEHEMATYCGPYRFGFRGSVVCDPTKPPNCGGDPDCEAANQCNKGSGLVGKHLPWLGVL